MQDPGPVSSSDPAESEIRDQKASPLKRFGPLVALAAGIATVYLTGAHEYLSLQAVAENRDLLVNYVTANLWLAIGLYAIVYIAVVAFSLPGAALLTILGGFLFGPLVGGATTVVAATIGATAVFLIARSAFGDVLIKRAGPWVKSLADGFNDDAFNYLMFLRLVPLFPFFVVNVAPALFNVKLRTFVVTTLIGIIPGTFAYSFVGSGLDSIITAQKAAHEDCIAEKGAADCPFTLDAGSLITPQLLLAFAALGIVALIPVVVKKWRARKAQVS